MSPLQILNSSLPFRPAHCRETQTVALIAAQASLMSYGRTTAEDERSWECRINQISKDDADVTVFQDDDLAIVACRGSQFTWSDWIRNLSATETDFAGGSAHAGFVEGFARTVPDVLRLIDSRKKVLFTGHSQGAANATCYAASCFPFVRDSSLITFGSPGVFCGKLARRMHRFYGRRHLRFMFSNDIVPRVPGVFRNRWIPIIPTARKLRHWGTSILMLENGNWIVNGDRATLEKARIRDFRFDLIRDHFMHNYVGALASDFENADRH